MITTRTHRSIEATQVLVDVTTPEGAQSGLLATSVVNCSNVFTVEQRKLLRLLGGLSPSLMAQVDASLKAAFALT
jgi:mRNA-degrading endonuclease toxin of MazEF toxin-antitoxin module